jgi:type IV pilus assembly protein PilB
MNHLNFLDKIDIVAYMSNAFKKQIEAEIAKGKGLSIINLVGSLIAYANSIRSSDIHIDAKEESIKIRYRIDGVLKEMFNLPKDMHSEIISRIKILSSLRTDEHQTTQDGRFRMNIEASGVVDVRVAVSPAYHGESVVLRLLTDKASLFTLGSLGFSESNQAKILEAIKKPYGMILATGPTGSGKTTSLYTILKLLNTDDVAIITIEDPIEYAMDNIRQIPVNNRTGLTFSTGLRSILRQDPDIIMVGEIRDEDTAGLAVNTALTGHLLLSTLHTNDAATTLPRLFDMKIEPYLIASTVNIALAQRLVRKICENCKEPHILTPAEISSLTLSHVDLPSKQFFKGRGCEACNNTGYEGRIGIHEVMLMDNELRQAILNKESSDTIKAIAVKNGMITMIQDGFEKAQMGITTAEEVLRVIHE